jgi:colicin import membrane protein
MARRLKTYQTSSGFFDLAIAAPSMKAAAEAWGSRTNVFKQGLAKETRDPAIVAATLAKPGVILRRPVGSKEAFREHARLPKHLPIGKGNQAPAKASPRRQQAKSREVDDKAAKAAALAFERQQKRREETRRREEAAREKKRARREQEIAKAERALDQAEQEHETKIQKIARERTALDKRSQAEEEGWKKQKEKLENALSRARGSQ